MSFEFEPREPWLAALKLRDTVRGAVVGAALGAVALALGEAVTLSIGAGHGYVAWASAAPAALLGAVGAFVACGLTLVIRGALIGMARQGTSWIAPLGAIFGTTFSVLGAQALVLELLSGQGIRTAVVSLSAAFGVLAGAGIALALQAVLARLRLQAGPRGRVAVVLVLLIATLVGAIALAPGFVDELDVPGLLVASAPLATALIGAVIGQAPRTLLWGALGAYFVVALTGSIEVLSPTAPKQALHIERGSHATRLFQDVRLTLWPRELAPIVGSGTCKPRVRPGALIGERKARDDAPDIVLITADAVRWDHITPSGYARDTTPNIARWAKRAAVFSAAYSPSSSTRSSFRALFSGLYPSLIPHSEASKWWALTFPKDQRTLALYLAKAGYRTFAGVDRREGFDHKEGNALIGFNRRMPRDPNAKSKTQSRAAATAARARYQIKSLLEEVAAERTDPLFAWTHVMVAHQPYSYETRNPYGSKEIDRYDWSIHLVDELVGNVLDTLEAQGRMNKTYVVLSADHGQAFGEHGNKLHGRTVYQEETNVPLIVWGPGVTAGMRNEPVAQIDVFPTMLELAGLGRAPHVCGESLTPWLSDPKAASTRDVYIEKIPDARADFALAYIHDWHKLVVSPRSCSIEVFDLRKDKHDARDISDDEPGLTRDLMNSLRAFQKERGMNPKSYCLD